VFRRIEADQPQCVLEIGEALLGRRVHAKALPAPFGDRMQRGVLQKLRSAPLAPGMGCLSQLRAELFDESRLAEPRFPNRQLKLFRFNGESWELFGELMSD
jgi:hypothetical protein